MLQPFLLGKEAKMPECRSTTSREVVSNLPTRTLPAPGTTTASTSQPSEPALMILMSSPLAYVKVIRLNACETCCRTTVEEAEDLDLSKMQARVSYTRLDALAPFLGRRVSLLTLNSALSKHETLSKGLSIYSLSFS